MNRQHMTLGDLIAHLNSLDVPLDTPVIFSCTDDGWDATTDHVTVHNFPSDSVPNGIDTYIVLGHQSW